MVYVGIDLHKKTITLCVVNQERGVVVRKTLVCSEPGKIVEFFRGLGKFQAVVEATASYEWLWLLLEPLACCYYNRWRKSPWQPQHSLLSLGV